MTDTFRKHTRSLTSPPEHGTAVVPDEDLPHISRALYVGDPGDLAVRLQNGTELLLANVPAGTLIPIRVSRVLAAGTSAGRIVSLW